MITFVKTRHHYDSYTDFWKLVELSGFPAIFVDELDIKKDGVYITSPVNGEWRPHLDNHMNEPRNAHLVLWNLERPSGSSGSIGKYAESNRELMYKRYFDEVWVSDRRLADETSLRYVTLGSHKGLGELSDEKHYDFCHMSYELPRRQTILKYFHPTRVGQNCWPPERDKVLKASKFAVNIHQDNHPFQEPLRFALFAAYGLPIISETIYDAYPYSADTMIFATYENLVNTIKEILRHDYARFKSLGLKTHQMMTEEFEFGEVVKTAIDQSVGWR